MITTRTIPRTLPPGGRVAGGRHTPPSSRHARLCQAAAEDTKTVAELIEEQGIDMSISGLRHLPEETQHRYAETARPARVPLVITSPRHHVTISADIQSPGS